MERCYPSASDAQIDEFMTEVVDRDRCWGAFDNDRVVSTLSIVPFEIYFWGRTVSMGGIRGVATPPEFRRRGYAADLLIKALEVQRGEGSVFSFLAPSNQGYYGRYGWELGFHSKRYTFDAGDLRSFYDERVPYAILDETCFDAIASVYESFAKSYNGPLRRERKDWAKRMRADGGRTFCYGCFDETNALQGYVIYGLEGKCMDIHELGYRNPAARKAALGFAWLLRGQIEEVVWTAPMSDDTDHIPGTHPKRVEVLPGMMVRVVDVQRLLSRYPYSPSLDVSCVFHVQDPHAAWNTEPFRITVHNGRAQLENSSAQDVDFACSMQVFSQILIGRTSVTQAAALDLVDARDRGKLDAIARLFPTRPTFINDSF